MIITRSRTHKFNMAQYENLEISATIVIDTAELDPDDDPVATANEVLDAVLQPDIDRADEASKTPEDETYAHAWKDSI